MTGSIATTLVEVFSRYQLFEILEDGFDAALQDWNRAECLKVAMPCGFPGRVVDVLIVKHSVYCFAFRSGSELGQPS